jgi:hypothetical protein
MKPLPLGEPTVLFNTVLFTGNANPALSQEIASHLGVELGRAMVGASPTVRSPSRSSRTSCP